MGTFQFSIPKPCHEDWNKMSPQEKGRFCDKCSKTVHDFSSQSQNEIQEYLKVHEHEKICGHFRNNQLKKPIRVEIMYRSFFNRLSLSQAFILSLLIVFGTTLLSCKTHTNDIVGEINLTSPVKKDSIKNDSTNLYLRGEVSSKEIIISTEPKPIQRFKKLNLEDTVIQLPEVNIEEESINIYDRSIVGLMTVSISCFQEIDNSNQEESNEISAADELVNRKNKESDIYPIPASDIVNLILKLSEETKVTIELFDLKGRQIRMLQPSQRMSEGEHNLQFDVSELPPATYLLRIVKYDSVETKRIVVL
jgi:hypothetical protein